MKSSRHLFRHLTGIFVLTITLIASADVAVIVNITEFSATTFTVAVSGTLDRNADIGKYPSEFAITLNQFASVPFYVGSPSLQYNTLSTFQYTPTLPAPTNTDFFPGAFAICFGFDSVFPQYAGAVFSGSAGFTGNFLPAVARPQDFQLWPGYNYSAPP